MKLAAELEVSPSNRVSRRDEKALQPSAVERAVVSPSGEWMATVDVRETDDSFRGEVYLKIWHWEKAGGFWELNTRVDRPHGLSAISAVSFSDHTHLLVTTGRDGYIKTWRLKTVNERRSGNAERERSLSTSIMPKLLTTSRQVSGFFAPHSPSAKRRPITHHGHRMVPC